MPSDRRSGEALITIRDAILSAWSFVEGHSFERFREDRRTFHAVTRLLEIISEASRRLPDDVRARHARVQWRDIRDAGNVYRHRYDDVSDTQVWSTVTYELSDLYAAVCAEIDRGPV